MEEERI